MTSFDDKAKGEEKESVRPIEEIRIKLVVCMSKSPGNHQVIGDFLRQLDGSQNLDFASVPEFKDIDVQTYQNPGTLVLVSALSKDDLIDVIKLMDRLESDIREGTVRVIVYDQLNNDKLSAFFKSKGVSEIIKSGVSIKTFNYKVIKHFKLLQQTVKASRNFVLANPEAFLSKATKTGVLPNSEGKQKKILPQVVYDEPIEHFSDFWILTKATNIRHVNGKWFVGLYGPGPSAGNWEPADWMTRNGLQGWVWKPRSETDKRFYKDEGRWVFFGSKPEFSWEERQWYFISKKPDFSFCYDKMIVHTRIAFLESGDLLIHHNSKIGMSLKPEIDATMEGALHRSEPATRPSQSPERQDGFQEGAYQGVYANDFEARKKHYHDYYECSELKLGLFSRNGVKNIQKPLIELVELRDRYVVLDAPAGLIDIDDLIELEAFYIERGVSKQVLINAATHVVETEMEPSETLDEQGNKKALRSLVICELSDELEPQFIQLVRSFKVRREELNEFFNKAKGVA